FATRIGTRDKSKALELNPEEKAQLPLFSLFIARATSPELAHRFSSAMDALDWLREQGTASENPSVESQVTALYPNEVPWLKSLLQLFPGSLAYGNIETRGLDSPFAAETYVETALEESLFKAIRERQLRLVILCGNAGDGKTALLQHLAQRFGVPELKSAERLWNAK